MSDYQGEDIYCDLIIPRKVDIEVVTETANVLAYFHTSPKWETHIVVTPKAHVGDLTDIVNPMGALEFFNVINTVIKELKQTDGGCKLITNFGTYQDSKHLHVHIVSGNERAK